MNYLYLWQYYFFLWYNIIKLAETHTPYKTIALEDFDVCSEVTRQGINFEFTYALNLTQSRLSYHPIQWATSVNCNFRLKVNRRGDGIIAVIQELSFRVNESTGECIDYVQFKTERGRTSDKICGNKNANHIMNLQPNNFDTQAIDITFMSDIGHSLDVFVHIAKKALKADEATKINIIFTIYNFCIRSPSDYLPCLETREICIHESYFADGVINCPFFGCVDEGGCNELVTASNSIGKKVLIGSATTLVFIFIVFIVCVYICRKQRKLCWSDNFASPNTTMQTQSDASIIAASPKPGEMREEDAGSSGDTSKLRRRCRCHFFRRTSCNSETVQLRPNARVIEMNDSPTQSPNTSTVAQPSDQEDKDLPPSYESLFPSR